MPIKRGGGSGGRYGTIKKWPLYTIPTTVQAERDRRGRLDVVAFRITYSSVVLPLFLSEFVLSLPPSPPQDCWEEGRLDGGICEG